MKLKHILTFALALGLTAGSALAQNDTPPGPPGAPPDGDQGPGGPPPDGGPGGRHHRPPPFMEVLDADHDGVISAAEIANAAKALLVLDKDGDGKLTMEEFLGPPPGHRPDGQNGDRPPRDQDKDHPHPPVPPIFAALDTDGDGVLSAAEIAAAPQSLLKLDKNGDGQLTLDEVRPKHRPPPRDSGSNN